MKNKNRVLERIRQRIPLETKLKVAFQMHDYDNWKDGVYLGDAEKYVEVALNEIVDHVRRHNPRATYEELLLYNVSNSVCPECGYPKFKKSFEDFERCHGCEWISKGK